MIGLVLAVADIPILSVLDQSLNLCRRFILLDENNSRIWKSLPSLNAAVWGKVRIVHSRVLLKWFIDQQRFPFDKNSNPGGMCVGEENFMTNVARKRKKLHQVSSRWRQTTRSVCSQNWKNSWWESIVWNVQNAAFLSPAYFCYSYYSSAHTSLISEVCVMPAPHRHRAFFCITTFI